VNPAVVVHHPVSEQIKTVLLGAGYTIDEVGSAYTVFRLPAVLDSPPRRRRGRTPNTVSSSEPHQLRPSRITDQDASLQGDDRDPAPLAVSPRGAARYLGVGHDLVYTLVYQGRLRSVKVGRRRLIAVAELRRFLQEEAV
jgi:excisionase family DNA binding protein